MQDRPLAHQLHRIERQLNILVLLLGGLVTLAFFTVISSSGLHDVPVLLFILVPGILAVLLCAYLIAAIVTPGRPQPEASAATPEAEGE